MRSVRRSISVLVLGALALLPLPSCAGPGGGPIGQLMGLAMGAGASVGTYFLVEELKK